MSSAERKIHEARERIESLLKGDLPDKIRIEDCSDNKVNLLLHTINQLIDSCSEIHNFLTPLSHGNLDIEVPSRKNILSSPFKALYSSLKHLTWQAQQVAKGDYSQRVDFMGDFSHAFNEMVAGLDEKEKKLNEKIKELETVKARLENSLEEKEILLKEIHHRVKNNMNTISSILALQAFSVKDEKITEIFNDCQSRIISMSLIHEKLYGSKDLSKINFKDYIETLTQTLFGSYKKDSQEISLKMDVNDVFLDIDTAIPIGLIINELVTNTLKYAFPEGKEGELAISFSETEKESFILKVRDNGIGLPENFDYRNTQSLGFQLIVLLAEKQLKGKVDLERNGGTEFRIIFKRPKPKNSLKK